MILQLNPPLIVITPLGEAEAHFLQSESDLIYFGVFQKATGEQWWWENNHVRLATCLTGGRFSVSCMQLPSGMDAALSKHRERHK